MISINEEIDNYFGQLINALNFFNKESMNKFLELLLDVYDRGASVFIFGNGGSGANASHFAGDFTKGIFGETKSSFRVICLNDNLAAFSAIANDISYQEVFSEQLKNFVRRGDLVIGISVSGNSINIIRAIEYAKTAGAKTVAFCGFDGGRIKAAVDLALHVNLNNMEVSEDIHLAIIHCVKRLVIAALRNKRASASS